MEVAPEARESEQGSSISVPTGQDMPPKTDQGKEEGASSPTKKEVETLPPKEEETVVEGEPVRRRRIQFGSAHLHLLKAVAEADQANWTSLQEAITRAPQPAKVKSEFVERLTQLADLRVKSQEAAEEKAVEHARRAKHYTEAETQYRAGLNNQILRLEMMNPVGPRTGVPIISDRRLQQDIEAGRPIWMARREHRARERAARHRQEQAKEAAGARGAKAGPLQDVDPAKGGEAIDEELNASAREDLQRFRETLRAEAEQGKDKKSRPPDSDRRRKLKKQKKREKQGHSKDDAERDHNHAIAHVRPGGRQPSEARFSPGRLLLPILVSAVNGRGLTEIEELPSQLAEVYVFDQLSGALFDVLLAMLTLTLAWGLWQVVKAFGGKEHPKGALGEGPPSRRVGGTRKKVRFNLPKKGRRIEGDPQVPFLGGPKAAKRRRPPDKPLRVASVQGRHEYDQEGFSLLLSRYSQSTAVSYQAQWKWWSLFCQRRGTDPVRFITQYNRAEEQLVIDYLVHCASNEAKAPGTIKLRLSAIRSMHLTLGYPDPLAHMPRIPLALAGLRRRFGTKERRMPVTPDMLKWLGNHLSFGKSEEASLLWAALVLGFFFLLRASEYLDVGYQDPRRGLRGSDITLKLNGKALGLDRISEADEVTLLVRGSKTDIYNRGQVRNHFRTEHEVCAVKALIQLYLHFPQRYQGGAEAEELLFRTREDKPVPRAAIQALIERAAKGLNLPEGDLGTHSLRFGGASALWAQYQDTSLVKRWGRWASDSFQTYIWEARETARGVSQKMITADLTPS